MKKIPVIVFVVLGVAFAGLAQADAKKRTRNQNRVGPYGAVLVGMTKYTEDHSVNEGDLLDALTNSGIPYQNVSASTDDSDIGYQAAFGYRFNRYFAAELALAQYGSLKSSAHGELDIPNDGQGFVPVDIALAFHLTGPVFSAIGILPLGNDFELYARLGYLLASSERELTSSVSGQSGSTGSARGDSQNPVYGIGATWNINQVYSIRAEYQMLSNVGQASRTGTEDLKVMDIGMMMRF